MCIKIDFHQNDSYVETKLSHKNKHLRKRAPFKIISP